MSRDLTVNPSIFFSPNYKGNEKRGEVIITLDFHFGWKKCTDASASSSSVERCRHKRSLDPFIFTSFSSANILFQSVCWTLKEDPRDHVQYTIVVSKFSVMTLSWHNSTTLVSRYYLMSNIVIYIFYMIIAAQRLFHRKNGWISAQIVNNYVWH